MISLFTSSKPKTVATVMESFLKIISDLDQIAEDNMALTVVLEEQRTTIGAQIETADMEVDHARKIAGKLTNLCGMDVPV